MARRGRSAGPLVLVSLILLALPAAGRLKLGALAIDLARSSIVRFGPRSRRVVLRLAIVPGRQLRGRRLVLGMSARNDRGRRQAARLAAVIRVR